MSRGPVQPADVVGPDQDYRNLRTDAVDLTVHNPPQQMRRPIAAETETERVSAGVITLPDTTVVA
jgi:hypothetical protein